MTQIDQIDRRGFLKKSGLVGAAAVGLSWNGLPWSGLGEADAATPAGHCRWGSLVLGRGGQDQMDAVKALEQKVGRRFDTTHYRMPWATPLVNSFTSWSANTGHTQILSWFARGPGGLVSWQGIANGDRDAWITTQARHAEGRRLEGLLLLPQGARGRRQPHGLEGRAQPRPPDLRQRGRHRHEVGRHADGLDLSEAGPADQWMPAKYDLLGVDGYNRYHCRGTPWKPFSSVFSYARNYAKAKGRNLYVIESGCVEGEPGRKAAWFDGAAATLKTWPEVVGVSYNSEDTDCTYWADSTSSSLSSFSAMGRDAYFA